MSREGYILTQEDPLRGKTVVQPWVTEETLKALEAEEFLHQANAARAARNIAELTITPDELTDDERNILTMALVENLKIVQRDHPRELFVYDPVNKTCNWISYAEAERQGVTLHFEPTKAEILRERVDAARDQAKLVVGILGKDAEISRRVTRALDAVNFCLVNSSLGNSPDDEVKLEQAVAELEAAIQWRADTPEAPPAADAALKGQPEDEAATVTQPEKDIEPVENGVVDKILFTDEAAEARQLRSFIEQTLAEVRALGPLFQQTFPLDRNGHERIFQVLRDLERQYHSAYKYPSERPDFVKKLTAAVEACQHVFEKGASIRKQQHFEQEAEEITDRYLKGLTEEQRRVYREAWDVMRLREIQTPEVLVDHFKMPKEAAEVIINHMREAGLILPQDSRDLRKSYLILADDVALARRDNWSRLMQPESSVPVAQTHETRTASAGGKLGEASDVVEEASADKTEAKNIGEPGGDGTVPQEEVPPADTARPEQDEIAAKKQSRSELSAQELRDELTELALTEGDHRINEALDVLSKLEKNNPTQKQLGQVRRRIDAIYEGLGPNKELPPSWEGESRWQAAYEDAEAAREHPQDASTSIQPGISEAQVHDVDKAPTPLSSAAPEEKQPAEPTPNAATEAMELLRAKAQAEVYEEQIEEALDALPGATDKEMSRSETFRQTWILLKERFGSEGSAPNPQELKNFRKRLQDYMSAKRKSQSPAAPEDAKAAKKSKAAPAAPQEPTPATPEAPPATPAEAAPGARQPTAAEAAAAQEEARKAEEKRLRDEEYQRELAESGGRIRESRERYRTYREELLAAEQTYLAAVAEHTKRTRVGAVLGNLIHTREDFSKSSGGSATHMEEARVAYEAKLNEMKEKRAERLALSHELLERSYKRRLGGVADPNPHPEQRKESREHKFAALHEAIVLRSTSTMIELARGIGGKAEASAALAARFGVRRKDLDKGEIGPSGVPTEAARVQIDARKQKWNELEEALGKRRDPSVGVRLYKASMRQYRMLSKKQQFMLRVAGGGAFGALTGGMTGAGLAALRAGAGFLGGAVFAGAASKYLLGKTDRYARREKHNIVADENMSLSNKQEQYLKVRKKERNYKRASVAASGALAFAAGATAGQAAAHVAESGIGLAALGDAEAWTGVPRAIEGYGRNAHRIADWAADDPFASIGRGVRSLVESDDSASPAAAIESTTPKPAAPVASSPHEVPPAASDGMPAGAPKGSEVWNGKGEGVVTPDGIRIMQKHGAVVYEQLAEKARYHVFTDGDKRTIYVETPADTASPGYKNSDGSINATEVPLNEVPENIRARIGEPVDEIKGVKIAATPIRSTGSDPMEARTAEVLKTGTRPSVPEAHAENVRVTGTYENNGSVEQALDSKLRKLYPDLTSDARGAAAHRIVGDLAREPGEAQEWNVRDGKWDSVGRGDRYDATIRREVIERNIGRPVPPEVSHSVRTAPQETLQGRSARVSTQAAYEELMRSTSRDVVLNNMESLRITAANEGWRMGQLSRGSFEHVLNRIEFPRSTYLSVGTLRSGWDGIAEFSAKDIFDRTPGAVRVLRDGTTVLPMRTGTETMVRNFFEQADLRVTGGKLLRDPLYLKNRSLGEVMNDLARIQRSQIRVEDLLDGRGAARSGVPEGARSGGRATVPEVESRSRSGAVEMPRETVALLERSNTLAAEMVEQLDAMRGPNVHGMRVETLLTREPASPAEYAARQLVLGFRQNGLIADTRLSFNEYMTRIMPGYLESGHTPAELHSLLRELERAAAAESPHAAGTNTRLRPAVYEEGALRDGRRFHGVRSRGGPYDSRTRVDVDYHGEARMPGKTGARLVSEGKVRFEQSVRNPYAKFLPEPHPGARAYGESLVEGRIRTDADYARWAASPYTAGQLMNMDHEFADKVGYLRTVIGGEMRDYKLRGGVRVLSPADLKLSPRELLVKLHALDQQGTVMEHRRTPRSAYPDRESYERARDFDRPSTLRIGRDGKVRAHGPIFENKDHSKTNHHTQSSRAKPTVEQRTRWDGTRDRIKTARQLGQQAKEYTRAQRRK